MQLHYLAHPGQYIDVIMSAIESQITGVSFVYLTVCSAYQRKYQSSSSLPFVWEFTDDREIPPTTGQ